MIQVTDEELLKKTMRGDSKAFESLFARHKKAVFGLAFYLMGSKMLAEEISQESWVRVVQRAETYSGKGAVRSWILTITRNLCLNELGRRQWEEPLPTEAEMQIADEGTTREDLIQSEKNMTELQKAIATLPDRQRVVLVLFTSEEKTHSEIAREMDLEINAVKALLFRARENLKTILKKEGG